MSADGFNAFGQLPAAPSPQELMFYELNDLGNAKRLIRLAGAQFGDHDEVDLRGARLLYLRDHGWIAFDGVRWDLARGPALARKLAHRVAEGLWAQAAAFARSRSGKANAAGEAGEAAADDARSEAEKREAALDAQAVKVKPKKDRQDPAIADFYEFARSSGNAGRTNALLQQAESYLLVELEAFDHDPLAFNVRNGTLRFAKVSGGWEMRFSAAHDPADRITRVMEVDYDPKATAPRWNKAIAAWQPAAPMRDFLARISGYGATGDTSEQAFFIYQGLGGDGKSTFIGALRRIMGDYAATADVKTFLDTGQRSGSDASSDVARLAGETRMVCTAEPPRGAKLNEAMIKSFTGGAPLPARRLRQEQFEFQPKGKVFLECNTRPVIKGDDEGIWRRVFIVLWEVRVSARDRIKDYDRILATEEGPGILNWLLAGVGDWLEQGLDPPRRVSEALNDYRKGSSPFGEWLAECVVVDREARTPASDFFKSYKDWLEAQDSDAKPMSQRAFGTALGERQILRDGKNAAGNIMRRGARLKTELELAEDRAAEAVARESGSPEDDGGLARGQLDGAGGGYFPGDGEDDDPFGNGR